MMEHDGVCVAAEKAYGPVLFKGGGDQTGNPEPESNPCCRCHIGKDGICEIPAENSFIYQTVSLKVQEHLDEEEKAKV